MTAGMRTNVAAVAIIIDFKNKKAACTSNLEVQAAFFGECRGGIYAYAGAGCLQGKERVRAYRTHPTRRF